MSSAEQARGLCGQAEALIDLGRVAEAGERLSEALRLEPRSALALGLMSLVRLRQGERREALRLAEESVAAEPHREWGHRVLSIALRASGKHKKALESARESVRLAPDSPDPLRNLAVSLMQVRRFKEARQMADRIVALAPELAHGYELLALVSAAEGRKKDAEKHWREALALDPENATFQNNLALVLLGRGAHGEAVDGFLGALRNNPMSDAYHANLGVGLERFRSPATHYFLLTFLGFLVFLSIVSAVDLVVAGKWRGEKGSEEVASVLWGLILWGGISFFYVRHFLKWRKERQRILPVLKTWRPRKPWIVRFFAGWQDAVRSPVLALYFGILLLLLVVGMEPDGPWLYLVPAGMVLWGLWGWILGKGRKPPIDTEL